MRLVLTVVGVGVLSICFKPFEETLPAGSVLFLPLEQFKCDVDGDKIRLFEWNDLVGSQELVLGRTGRMQHFSPASISAGPSGRIRTTTLVGLAEASIKSFSRSLDMDDCGSTLTCNGILVLGRSGIMFARNGEQSSFISRVDMVISQLLPIVQGVD